MITSPIFPLIKIYRGGANYQKYSLTQSKLIANEIYQPFRINQPIISSTSTSSEKYLYLIAKDTNKDSILVNDILYGNINELNNIKSIKNENWIINDNLLQTGLFRYH